MQGSRLCFLSARIAVLAFFCAVIFNSCAASRMEGVRLSIRQQNWQRAQEGLEELVRQNPRDGKALLLLVEVYGELDMAEKMMHTVHRLHRLSPQFHESLTYLTGMYWRRNFDRGLKQFHTRNYAAAVVSFRRAVTIDSTNSHSQQKYADALFMAGRYYEARKQYQAVLKKDPENPVLLNNLSEIFFIEKKYMDAIRLCDEILARDQTQINALMRRAYAYNALGKFNTAEEDFILATTLNPTARLFTDFGLMYFRNHRYREAIRQFEQALFYTKEALQLYHYLGEANWKMKDYRAMVTWYQKVVKTNPHDLAGWKNLAIAYEALGKRQLLSEARHQINQIIRTN